MEKNECSRDSVKFHTMMKEDIIVMLCYYTNRRNIRKLAGITNIPVYSYYNRRYLPIIKGNFLQYNIFSYDGYLYMYNALNHNGSYIQNIIYDIVIIMYDTLLLRDLLTLYNNRSNRRIIRININNNCMIKIYTECIRTIMDSLCNEYMVSSITEFFSDAGNTYGITHTSLFKNHSKLFQNIILIYNKSHDAFYISSSNCNNRYFCKYNEFAEFYGERLIRLFARMNAYISYYDADLCELHYNCKSGHITKYISHKNYIDDNNYFRNSLLG